MIITQRVNLPTTQLGDLSAHYNPTKNTWKPADESFYKPVDLYRVPLDDARNMQLKMIKYTFTRHYNNKGLYYTYCETMGARSMMSVIMLC